MSTPLLLIGSLPPEHSPAAALMLHTAKALGQTHSVLCVIDDLAPPPATPDIEVIRQRELKRDWSQYAGHQRLYILGQSGACQSAMYLLQKAPGLVMPAEVSLFDLAEPATQAVGDWPDGYWTWLTTSAGEDAERLYSARAHHRRYSAGQKLETPAFRLLLESTSGVIAPSPAAAAALAASGITPDLILDLPIIATPAGVESAKSGTHVLYVDHSDAAATTTARHFSGLGHLKNVHHRAVHPASSDLPAAIAGADIVALLAGRHDAASPALALALMSGKPVITAGQQWAAHLPTGCHLGLPHEQAFDALAVSVGALATDENLKKQITKTAARFVADRTRSDGLSNLIAQTPVADASIGDQRPCAPQKKAQHTLTDLPDVISGQWALIGAVPPVSVLRQVAPDLAEAVSPRFATPALAARLSALTGEHGASLLARMGYEAPVVQAEGDIISCHRTPVPLGVIQQNLKCGQKAIAFGCNIMGASDGDPLCQRASPPTLAIQIDFDSKDPNAPTHGFLSDAGLFWHEDTARPSLQGVMMVGLGDAPFRLSLSENSPPFMVASEDGSQLLMPGTNVQLSSDGLGLLSFTLMALDAIQLCQATRSSFRETLAKPGLRLEWLGQNKEPVHHG